MNAADGMLPPPRASAGEAAVVSPSGPPSTAALHLPSGGARAIFDAIIAADHHARSAAALGLVVAAEGSTYAKPGALLGFGPAPLRQGWISGGCLEPILEHFAHDAINERRARSVILDTRDEADLLFGSRIGCRGRQQIILIPLMLLPGLQQPLTFWSQQAGTLNWRYSPVSGLALTCAGREWTWPLTWSEPPGDWSITTPAAHRVRVYGAGPETPWLLPGLRALGAYVDLVERRPRWLAAATLADSCANTTPSAAVSAHPARYALVQHHDFELDREALLALADDPGVHWMGLLGPAYRRDQLLRLLPESAIASLQPRLHAPVGLPLGGHGPEAISLSVCAQLQKLWTSA